MKTTIPNVTKMVRALSVLVLGLFASGSALAWGHGPHVRFGVAVGGPLWWGPGYYPPYYYNYPPPYGYAPAYYPAAPAAPAVYIERGSAASAPVIQPAPAAQPQVNYWYYCAEAKGYYPYVDSCPGGWQRVSPQPPPG